MTAHVFSPESLAARWDCSPRHVRNLINDGALPAFRLGRKLLRISAEAVERYEQCQLLLGKLNGECVLVYYVGGKRRRFRLGTSDPREAAIRAPRVFAELTRPKGKTVEELWRAFVSDKTGRRIIMTMDYTWKVLRERFAYMHGDSISVEDCRAHTKERRETRDQRRHHSHGVGPPSNGLNWSVKQGLFDKASHIERPTPPKRKEAHLTREQARALIDAAQFPHLRVYIILALGTGARNAALLELTWDRCNFERD